MSTEVLGLVGLNVAFYVIGLGVLWGIRGWRFWTDLFRLSGLAYLLGIASTTVGLTWALVLGAPFGWPSVIGVVLVIASAGLATGLVRGHRVEGVRAPEFKVDPPWAAVAGVSLLVIYLEAMFRTTRLHPADEWDALWVWTLRAKSLFFSGELGGEQAVRAGEAALASYAPGVSILQAMGFLAMDSADAVTLHVQQSFLVAGFALAAAGLLAGRARAVVAVPFLVLVLAMPAFHKVSTLLYADLLLAFLVAAAALLVAPGFGRPQTWRFAAAALLLGSALLAKRDAMLIVPVLLVALAMTGLERRRASWFPFLGMSLGAAVLAAPWWIGSRHLVSAAPSSGTGGFLDQAGRLEPAFELVGSALTDVPFWLGMTWLIVLGGLLAVVAGKRALGAFVLLLAGLQWAGVALVIAAEPHLEFTRLPTLNPIDRLLLVSVVVAGVLVPLCIESVWRDRRDGSRGEALRLWAIPTGPRWARVAVLALAGIVYPVFLLLGG
jgi:hypothetical protein